MEGGAGVMEKAAGFSTEEVLGAPEAIWFVRWDDGQDYRLMPPLPSWTCWVMQTKSVPEPLPGRPWRDRLEEHLAVRA